ncbi:hypothetical protein Pint_10574 [Pistacia integerrima]|uniref:Uncharacterized protein n=1 Tax=Pistacia integerrima TaxID=434235 RepID=A0ACC0XF43_9ROSI|nr:hypothetical protein Pint_10574 [Pistacia integerrima]
MKLISMAKSHLPAYASSSAKIHPEIDPNSCSLENQDPVVYFPQEIKNLLQQIDEGNRATGGLNSVAKVFGIAGCIKFLESYYLILVTKRRQIGCICGHAIYSINETQLITIPHVSIQSDVAHSKIEFSHSLIFVTLNCLQWKSVEDNHSFTLGTSLAGYYLFTLVKDYSTVSATYRPSPADANF